MIFLLNLQLEELIPGSGSGLFSSSHPKSLQTQRSAPFGEAISPNFFGISAFLKGPHQLGSKIPIYLGGAGHHQIMTQPMLQMKCQRDHILIPSRWLRRNTPLSALDRRGWSSETGKFPSLPSTLPRLKTVWCCSEPRPVRCFQKMKTLRQILRAEGIVTKDDYSPTRSKGIQESFRRGLRDGAETPRKWNSRKSYREHPYWTDNLKYV